MKAQSRILDDIAGLAGGALSLAGSAKEQIREEIKARMEFALSKMDLVTREEFDRVEAMLKKAREEQIALEDRIKKLEEK